MANRGRWAALALMLAGCMSDPSQVATPIAATAVAIDATTVRIEFTQALAPSAAEATFTISAPLARSQAELAVQSVSVASNVLTLTTDAQAGGQLYAVRLGALEFDGVALADAPSQLNFDGYGTTDVTLTLDTRGFIVSEALSVLVTFDPRTSAHTDRFTSVPLTTNGDGLHSAQIAVRIDRGNTFAARAVTASGGEASALATFTATSTADVRVALDPRLPAEPEFDAPVDSTPGDGMAPVRIVLDDRFAHALQQPQLRTSLDSAGIFDITTSRVEPLTPVAGMRRVYETVLNVAVDTGRQLDGTTIADFPIVVFLVEGGEDIPQRGANFIVHDETPQVLVIPVGNPALVPVTFRVDLGNALLTPDGASRGLFPGEGAFLTGEFPGSEDALGRLAGDAFSGGERSTLELQERPDAPGIYEKTVFMGPNRPYGWKVVRCETGVGCAALNRHVSSSGRAFPTVMKNLVTANTDAASVSSVRLVDPAQPDRVELEDGSFADYSNAQVSLDGAESANPNVMFKQEAPDLVVMVGTEPIITPTYVIGTWRDINIEQTPAQIIEAGDSLSLAPFDYDDGLVGVRPLIRDTALPFDPGAPVTGPGQPAFDPTDGRADAASTARPSAGRLPLWVGWNERELYVATQIAMPGRDHFVIISLDEPTADRAAQWTKGGASAAGQRTFFLAMEGDGVFQGWFQRDPAGGDDTELSGAGVRSSQGDVVEGAIDLDRAGLGAAGEVVWIAVAAYGSADGGLLDAAQQNPAGDDDGDLDAAEFTRITLADVRAN